MSESELTSSSEDFVAFPHQSLVAAFHGAEALDRVINELSEAEFGPDEMRSFVGRKGMEGLDFDGSAHGPAAELLRYLQHIGPSRMYLERYKKYMTDGDSMLMVHAPKEQRKQIAAEIIRKHSAHSITYFGTLVIEEV